MNSMMKAIIEHFLEAYPGSAQARGGRTLRKGGWARIFPRIENDPQEKDAFLSAAEDLERRGIVSIKWTRHRRGDRIEALYLEDPPALYAMMGLPSPKQQREEALNILTEFRRNGAAVHASETGGNEDAFISNILEHLQGRIETHIPTPCGEPAALRDLLRLLETDDELLNSLPLRALSVRLYGDSKRLESLLPEADRLTMAAAGEKLSTHFALARNYPQAGLRGSAELVLSDGQSWKLRGETLFFSPQAVERLALVSAGAPVLLVENKETFMTIPVEACGFSLLLYGGGYLNSAAVSLMRLLEESGSELHYFGDLDPDGLLIFLEAERSLKGRLHPWQMDAETYSRYLPYAYLLSESSLSRLAQISPGRFDELISLIRKHRRGVEQEVVDTNCGL